MGAFFNPSVSHDVAPTMDEEFLILQCPACERNLKIKADAAGTRMGCPYCKEPIEIAADAGGSATEAGTEADEEEEPLPLNFRKIESAAAPIAPSDSGASGDAGEESSSASSPSTQESADHGQAHGERRKHRKRNIEKLAWDEEESEDGGDGDDDTAEFLEMDPDSPGGVRLKRVRRKKVLTRKDKFVRAVTITVFAAAAALAGLIIYAAVIRTASVVGTDSETKRELSEAVKIAMAEALANPDPVSPDLTSTDEKLAVATLTAFLEAKTIEDRLLYVRNPESTRPMMEQWYAANPKEATKEWPDANIILRKKIIDDDRYFIVLAADFVGDGQRVLALEQRANDDVKLDWPTTVGYQPMPIEKFKEAQPKTPTQFWVKVKPSDFYSFSFTKDKYQAVELSYPGKIEFKLIGYVDRSRNWVPALIAMLDSGQAPSLVVSLRYPPGEIKDASQVEIVSLTATTWWP